ncbi:Hypothetical predicted protein [Cloeon dipterum]|uniref:Uncharacterized protein n=1 Tax=Cloeon dipterum TaxID=197152 RepID=A0A8S1CMM7_9INSE|nr:Hypothetical predicted protein [Cloeon dipterum]
MRCRSTFILQSSRQLPDLITLDYCSEIKTSTTLAMASIPQGAFATFKIRANLSQKEDWNKREDDSKKPKDKNYSYPKFGQELLDALPVKYNGKLMNSIWGQYNKYSVHNFKQMKGDALVHRQPPVDEMIVNGMSACASNPTFFANKSG